MISWTFSNQKNRSASWYIAVTIIMLTLLVYGIITQLYLLSIVVVLFAGIYIYIENNSSENSTVIIDDKKIRIDSSEYFWENFSSFAIMESQWRAFFLRLFPKKRLSTYMDVPFSPDLDVENLRILLQNSLEENTNSELSQMDALLVASKI